MKNRDIDRDYEQASLAEKRIQLEEIWGDEHWQQYNEKIMVFQENLEKLRSQVDFIGRQTETLWHDFVSVGLGKILEGQPAAFIDDLYRQIGTLQPEMENTTNGTEELIADIKAYQELLGGKVLVLDRMTHPISTLHHLGMMASRVMDLETYLLDKKPIQADDHTNRQNPGVTLPAGLLYLRVRLLTTQSAMIAARKSKQITNIIMELYDLMFRAEQLKSEFQITTARVTCLSHQASVLTAFYEHAKSSAQPECQDTNDINTYFPPIKSKKFLWIKRLFASVLGAKV